MTIDTHCHYDMMENPTDYISKAESHGDIIIGMTNLPSHYRMGKAHVVGYKHIRLSLGFHPQLAATSQHELLMFDSLVNFTSYPRRNRVGFFFCIFKLKRHSNKKFETYPF